VQSDSVVHGSAYRVSHSGRSCNWISLQRTQPLFDAQYVSRRTLDSKEIMMKNNTDLFW